MISAWWLLPAAMLGASVGYAAHARETAKEATSKSKTETCEVDLDAALRHVDQMKQILNRMSIDLMSTKPRT